MKMQNIGPVLTAAQAVEDSILLIGLHGIGKTEIAINWAKENDIYLEVLYLSNNEVGDLVGIPVTTKIDDTEVTIWSEPVWLQRMRVANKEGKRTALFLDEFSRAPLDVRQAALQLVLDKKIHQHELPILNGEKTFIMAADNPDNGDYAVETLDPALLDRFVNIDVEVDTQGWLDWARSKNVNKIVRAFIVDNPTKIHFTPEEGSKDTKGATPRSWTKLAAYIDNFDKIPNEVHYPIIHGKIGKALGLQFLNFYNNYQSIISVEDIENLVKTLDKKKLHIEKIGEGVNEFLKDAEVIQITELSKSILEKYIDSKNDSVDAKILLGTLYGLNTEVLASTLKNLSNNEPENFFKLVQLDEKINNKGLFIRLTADLDFS